MMNKLVRSQAFIKVLHKVKQNRRGSLLRNFPKYVAIDIAEIIHNILLGNVKISPRQKAQLKRNRIKLMKIVKAGRRARPGIIYKQSGGGLFTMLLPIIASVIGGIVSGFQRRRSND